MASKLTRYCLRIIICCAIGLLIGFSAPSLVAAFWHATHNRVQQFDIYEFPVPLSFILRRQENGIELLRAKPVFSSSFFQFELIRITKHLGQISIKQWRDAAPRTFLRDGFTGVKAYDLQFGGSPVSCVEYFVGRSQVRTTVLCVNDGDIYIEYFGDAQGVSDLREFLQDVRLANR
jgi:hypothetical protein